MKKIIFSVFILIGILISIFPACGAEMTEAPIINAESAVMINIDTGEVVYSKNNMKSMRPASTVKIMTGIMVIEHFDNLTEQIVVKDDALRNIYGNSIDIKSGEVFTVEELLYAMLLSGANDAAMALAVEVAGSAEVFVALMNQKAVELGCTDTVFENPTGLDSAGMRTTADDVCKIALYAYSSNEFMEIAQTSRITIEPTNKTSSQRLLFNRNHLISKAQQTRYFYQYAKGLNAGSTAEAGYCLVSAAEQKGMNYLCVILNSISTVNPNTGTETVYSFFDMQALFEWIFSVYEYRTVVSTKKIITDVTIKLAASNDKVSLVPAGEIEALLPVNADIDTDVTMVWTVYEEKLVAPVQKGDVLGELAVTYKDSIIGNVKLLANSPIERSNVLYVLEYIKEIINRRWFKAGIITFLIFLTFYVVINVVLSNKKRKKRFY